MRTVYEVWAKANERDRYEVIGTFDDVDAAKEYLGMAPMTVWSRVDNRLIHDAPTYSFISIEDAPDMDQDRIELALRLIAECRGYDGQHHQLWLTDQVARILAGDRYEAYVAEHSGQDVGEWDEGIAP